MQDDNSKRPGSDQAEEQVYSKEGNVMNRKQKKNTLLLVSLALNMVLLIGLAVLYFLFFTSGKSEGPPVSFAVQKAGTKSTSIVFVNIDTLNSRYDFVRILKNDLESTGKKLQFELMAEQNAFEKEAADFQKQIANNAITEEKAKIIYEGLMQKQQALIDKKDRYTQQVADQELNLNLRLLDTVTNFLKRYNQKFNYDYIMGYKTAGEILLANDTLDITNDVISALNREYSEKKK